MDRSELLTVIIDGSTLGWSHLEGAAAVSERSSPHRSNFAEFIDTVGVFLSTIALQSHRHFLCVLSYNGTSGGYVLPRPPGSSSSAPQLDFALSGAGIRAADVRNRVRAALIALHGENHAATAALGLTNQSATLAACMALALCFHHRVNRSVPRLQSRILIFQAHADAPMQYIPLINAAYSAQRFGVAIDSVLLSAPERRGAEASVFLEQAAHLTGGLHTHPTLDDHDALLAFLVMHYSSNLDTRARLLLPPTRSIDLRAHCFCHRDHKSIAWVCSVCLSVYCDYTDVCATCGTRAPSSTVPAG